MFILSFPNKKTQQFLSIERNFEKLKKAIKRIEKPFEHYPGAHFKSYSVINNDEYNAVRSIGRIRGVGDNKYNALFIADFPTHNSGLFLDFYFENKFGSIVLFVEDKADLYVFNNPSFKFLNGTWNEVILKYLNLLKEETKIS